MQDNLRRLAFVGGALAFVLSATVFAASKNSAKTSAATAAKPPEASQVATAAPNSPEPVWHKSCTPANVPASGTAAGTEAGKAAQPTAQSCWIEQYAILVPQQYAAVMPKKFVLLHIRFSQPASDKTLMTVTAPLGVALMPGMTLSLDGDKPFTVPFDRCLQDGCSIDAVLDRGAIDNFSKGKTLTVHYNSLDKKSADIPVRMDGFADALKSLSR